MTEGGPVNYWINAFLDADLLWFDETIQSSVPPPANNISKYWSDGSYLETIESQATKVYYGSCWLWNNSSNQWKDSCDHSAVRVTSGTYAGKYESKWGQYGVYRHQYNHCPWISTNRRFYKPNYSIPTITGPNEFCNGSSKTYSVSSWKSCYTWASSSNLSISGTGSSITVSGTSGGDGWISLRYGNVEVVRKAIKVEVPLTSLTLSYNSNLGSGSEACVSASVKPTGQNVSYVWNPDPPCVILPDPPGGAQVSCTVSNTCNSIQKSIICKGRPGGPIQSP